MQVDYIAAFLIGLIGGFSHCIGMCGGFVLTYSVKISENEIRKQQTVWQRIYPHLSYSAGRIITYTFLGEIFGFIGGTIGLIFSMKNFQGGLQLFAGIIMFFMGLDLAGLIPVLPPNSFPGINAFKKLVGNLFNKVNRSNVFGLGIVLGFVPCGLVYSVGAQAAATQSLLKGGLTMLIFGLGTVPAMLLSGITANLISSRVRSRLYKLAALLVVLLGVLTVLRGVDALNWLHIYWLF